MGEDGIYAEIKNILDRVYVKVSNTEIDSNTIKEIENLRNLAEEQLKEYITKNTESDFTRSIMKKINKEDFYSIDKQKMINAIEKIEQDSKVKEMVEYLNNLSNVVYANSRYDGIAFIFFIKTRVKENDVELYLGTVLVSEENKIDVWLGESKQPIFEIKNYEEVNNDYERQMKGLINLLNKIIEELVRKLYYT